MADEATASGRPRGRRRARPAADEAPDEVRAQLALALDVDDLIPALRLARELRPWFGTMKVGLELYSAAGPEAITTLVDLGVDVFCDLKLHDIPNTVRRAARVIGALGARYLTLHTAGGVPMVRAGVEGLREGAAGVEGAEPTALGVTVLTSEPEASAHLLHQRVGVGPRRGMPGLRVLGARHRRGAPAGAQRPRRHARHPPRGGAGRGPGARRHAPPGARRGGRIAGRRAACHPGRRPRGGGPCARGVDRLADP